MEVSPYKEVLDSRWHWRRFQFLINATLEPVLVLWSDLVADPILLCNIGSYLYHSKSTLLSPSTFSLFRLWLPMQKHKSTVYIM